MMVKKKKEKKIEKWTHTTPVEGSCWDIYTVQQKENGSLFQKNKKIKT